MSRFQNKWVKNSMSKIHHVKKLTIVDYFKVVNGHLALTSWDFVFRVLFFFQRRALCVFNELMFETRFALRILMIFACIKISARLYLIFRH